MRGKREARNDEPTPKVRATVSPQTLRTFQDLTNLQPAPSKSSRSFRLSMESSQRLRLSQSQSPSPFATSPVSHMAVSIRLAKPQTAVPGPRTRTAHLPTSYICSVLVPRHRTSRFTVTALLQCHLSKSQTIVCPPLSASFRAFKPLKPGSSLFRSAPASSSTLATCSWPCRAASIKAVRPSLV